VHALAGKRGREASVIFSHHCSVRGRQKTEGEVGEKLVVASIHHRRQSRVPAPASGASGMLGTQETSCILIAGLLERKNFDLFLPEFNKPWVIHLKKT
jgi:hypothetical protein